MLVGKTWRARQIDTECETQCGLISKNIKRRKGRKVAKKVKPQGVNKNSDTMSSFTL